MECNNIVLMYIALEFQDTGMIHKNVTPPLPPSPPAPTPTEKIVIYMHYINLFFYFR